MARARLVRAASSNFDHDSHDVTFNGKKRCMAVSGRDWTVGADASAPSLLHYESGPDVSGILAEACLGIGWHGRHSEIDPLRLLMKTEQRWYKSPHVSEKGTHQGRPLEASTERRVSCLEPPMV